MVLSENELFGLVERGVIRGASEDAVNAASIDVHLGPVLLIEDTRAARVVDLSRRESPALTRIDLRDCPNGHRLDPGEWCLAQTHETFDLPNDLAAEFRLKSSGARSGLNQALAVWCDPGWTGSALTLEIMNVLRHHPIKLRYGQPIGQMIFHRVRPAESRAYHLRGRYNHDLETQGVKP